MGQPGLNLGLFNPGGKYSEKNQGKVKNNTVIMYLSLRQLRCLETEVTPWLIPEKFRTFITDTVLCFFFFCLIIVSQKPLQFSFTPYPPTPYTQIHRWMQCLSFEKNKISDLDTRELQSALSIPLRQDACSVNSGCRRSSCPRNLETTYCSDAVGHFLWNYVERQKVSFYKFKPPSS